MRSGMAIAALLIVSAASESTEAQKKANHWDLTGGPPWEARVGPGVMIAVGGIDCTDEYCEDRLNSSYWGSISGTVGAYYRIIPNLVALVDVHLGYMNISMSIDRDWSGAPLEYDDTEHDRGLLFQAIGGAEFHGPITEWADAYVGLGIGFAYLTASVEYDEEASTGDLSVSFRGIDFELRTGLDAYPFSAVPTLGMGLLFRLGMVYWTTACIDHVSSVDNYALAECTDPNEADWLDDDLPFLVHFGGVIRYGF